MKRCPKCLKLHNSNFEYCPSCGTKLITISMRGFLLLIAVIVIACISLIVIISKEQKELIKQREGIEYYRYQKETDERRNTPTLYDISILPEWTSHIKGNYVYIEGTVKNTSKKQIRYYEIGVRFYNSSGSVVDTDWTNGSDIAPGDSQKFEIMHKNDESFTNVKLYVKEVN